MVLCGNCGEEGHNRRTCTWWRGGLLLAQDDAFSTATYDGRRLKLNGMVLGQEDERRDLVTHIRHSCSSWSDRHSRVCLRRLHLPLLPPPPLSEPKATLRPLSLLSPQATLPASPLHSSRRLSLSLLLPSSPNTSCRTHCPSSSRTCWSAVTPAAEKGTAQRRAHQEEEARGTTGTQFDALTTATKRREIPQAPQTGRSSGL